MGEGQAALPSPARSRRHNIRVQTPCGDCRHSGLCAIEQQIEDNLVLEVIEIGLSATLALSCSLFEHSDYRKRPRTTWTEGRRARYNATIATKRGATAL